MKRKLFIVAMSIIIGSLSLLAGCQKSDSEQQIQYYESGDFIYRLENEKLYLDGLTEQGAQKETIVIPKEIDGYKVERMFRREWLGDSDVVQFGSSNLKELYILPDMNIVGINHDYAKKLDKIVFIGVNNRVEKISVYSSYEPANVYYSNIDRYEDFEVDECGRIKKGKSFINSGSQYTGYVSNCNYFYNYAGAENDGYYWSDNYDYGEKITYVPQDPEREGYIFGGWFKEPECVNIWNFDTDTLPEAKYNEEGETLYQETRLYAKWYQQSDQG